MYYCPHCHALNTSERPIELESGTNSGMASPPPPVDGYLLRSLSNASSSMGSEVMPHTPLTAHELPAVTA